MRRIDRMKAIFLATPALAAALVLAGCAEDTSSVVVPKLVGMRGAADQALLARRGLRSQWEQRREARSGQCLLPSGHDRRTGTPAGSPREARHGRAAGSELEQGRQQ